MADISGIWSSIQRDMWQDTGLNGDAQRIEQLGWMLFFKIFSDKDQELELLDDNYKSPIPPELHWDQWAGDDEGMTGEELQVFVDRTLFPTLRNIPVVGNKRALILREVFEGNNNYMKSGINIRKVLNKLNEIDFNVKDDRHAFGEIYESILKNLQTAGKSGEFYTPRAITQFITEMVDPQIGEKVFDPACGTGGFLTNAIEHLRKNNTNLETLKAINENVVGWEYKPLPFLLATTNLILHDVEVPNITFRDALDQPLTNYTEKDRVNVIIANPPFGGIVANNNETNFPQSFRTKESADLFLILMVHFLKKDGRCGVVLPDGSLTGDGIKQRIREKLLTECNLHKIIRMPNSVFEPYATIATNLLFFVKGTPTKEVWYYEHRLPEGQKSYNKTKPIRVEEFQPIRDWWNNPFESSVSWKVGIDDIKANNFDLDVKNPTTVSTRSDRSAGDFLKHVRDDFQSCNTTLQEIGSEMNFAPLIESFNELGLGSETWLSFGLLQSKKFVERLRDSFLHTAIRGRLIVQNAQDGSANQLLEELRAEKARLIAEKIIKKDDPTPLIKATEIPFEIPSTWTWCRLSDLADFRLGRTPASKDSRYWKDGTIPWANISDMPEYGTIEETQKKVTKLAVERAFNCPPSPIGTLLMSFKLTIGRTALLGIESYHNEAIISIYPFDVALKNYLFLFLPLFTQWGNKRTAVKGNTLNSKKLKNLLIPLPPMEEQIRICKKMERIMTLCAALQLDIETSRKDLEELVEVALDGNSE